MQMPIVVDDYLATATTRACSFAATREPAQILSGTAWGGDCLRRLRALEGDWEELLALFDRPPARF